MKTSPRSRTPRAVGNRSKWVVGAILGLALQLPSFAQPNCTPAPSGLIGWWASNGDALDRIGTNHGTLLGGATASSNGLVGAAFALNGTGYVRVEDAAELRPSAFTIEAWVYPYSLEVNDWKTVVSHGASGSGPLGCYEDTYYLGFYQGKPWAATFHDSGTKVLEGPSVVGVNQWYHLALAFDGSVARLYLNGSVIASTNVASPLVYEPGIPLLIGEDTNCNGPGNHKFHGLIDEVSLYNRTLSAGEIVNIYQAGSAGKCASTTPGLVLNHRFDPLTGVLTLWLPAKPAAYYTLEWTQDFDTFIPVGLLLGDPGPVWAYSVLLGPDRGFFRVQEHDIFSPIDTDGDGIDDRYELQHASCLNPLVYADASQPCLVPGLSNYQQYLRELFGGPGVALQFFSHETTVFNFGAPTANKEAISPELSVYNANPGSGPPTSDIINQVFSREVTTWNFGSPSANIEAIGRETTIWNFGSPSANIEANSKEISVYNANPGSGPPATEFNQIEGRELTVFNFGAPTAFVEAISREVSVLNFEEPTQP